MSCRDIQARLPDYALDHLAPDTATAIGEHIGVCDACRRELAALGQVALWVEQLPYEVPPAGLWERVEARLPAPPMVRGAWRWRAAVGLGAVTATLLLVFFGWFARPAAPPPALAEVPGEYRAFAQQYFLFEQEDPLADQMGSAYRFLTAAGSESER